MSDYYKADYPKAEYLTEKHGVSGRSIPILEVEGSAGVVSTVLACYVSKYVGVDHYAAMFNYSIEKDRFFLNGEETTAWIAKGDSFADCKRYEEGVEHSRNFVYWDMGYYGIDMLIKQIDAGFCTSADGVACVATSVVKSFGTIGDYVWTVTGATLTSGQGTDEIVVDTSDTTSVTYKVSLTTTLMGHSETIEREYIHGRNQVWTPIIINSLTETISGSCDYVSPGTCYTESTHVVSASGAISSYTWTTDDAFTVVSGLGTNTVVLSSDNSDTSTGIIKCVVSGHGYIDEIQDIVSHVRTDLYVPLALTDITEDVAGSCSYPTSGTCVASSEHTVVYDGVPDTITWSVTGVTRTTGVTIVAGQGTDTVTVESTGDIDMLFSLECKIEDTISFEIRTEDFTHTRTHTVGDLPDIIAINEIENLGCEYDGI